MSKSKDVVSITELLRGRAIVWPEPDRYSDVMRHVADTGAAIVFEDEYVVAFEAENDGRKVDTGDRERRVTIEPKRRLPSLLDIGTADTQLSAHLLFALQQVAFKLELHRAGFEVRLKVLPPYQRHPHFRMQIRFGSPRPKNPLS